MKKILLTGSRALLLLPGLAYAAFDDVSITTDVDITRGSITLGVHGSTASIASMEVTASSVIFSIESSSSVTIRSATGNSLAHDGTSTVVTQTCLSGVKKKTSSSTL